jgi:hypothetical protein
VTDFIDSSGRIRTYNPSVNGYLSYLSVVLLKRHQFLATDAQQQVAIRGSTFARLASCACSII